MGGLQCVVVVDLPPYDSRGRHRRGLTPRGEELEAPDDVKVIGRKRKRKWKSERREKVTLKE